MGKLKVSCKESAKLWKNDLKNKICKYSEKGFRLPHLVIIQVGNNPASNSYIKGKQKDCAEINICCSLFKFEESIDEYTICKYINDLNNNKDVDGIIVQLPLPKHIDSNVIANAIDPSKDVDGFNKNSIFTPCTPKGIAFYICKYNNIDLTGKDVLVVGRSNNVGKPLADILLELNATVTIAHSKTFNLLSEFQDKDLIFTCIDKISYFGKDYIININDDTNIIDIGLGIGPNGKLCGNFTTEAVEYFKNNADSWDSDAFIISGIGGVGLLTRAALLDNVFNSYKNKL